MKRFLALALLLFVLPLSSRADDASKHAKIDHLFEIMQMDALSKQITSAIMQQTTAMSKQMIGDKLDPALQKKLEDFQKRMMDLIMSQVGWKAMEPEYADLYAKTFTEQQIDDLLAFYTSPTGKVFIEKTPELTKGGMQLAQERLKTLQPQVKQLLDDFEREVVADAKKDSAPAASPTAKKPATSAGTKK